MCIICNSNIPDSNIVTINDCNKLTYDIFIKYQYINKINNLAIINCNNLSMIPIINKLNSLTIDNCSKITFILINTKLRHLSINNCNQLYNIPIIDSLYSLYINNCPKLYIIPSINILKKLNINNSNIDNIISDDINTINHYISLLHLDKLSFIS